MFASLPYESRFRPCKLPVTPPHNPQTVVDRLVTTDAALQGCACAGNVPVASQTRPCSQHPCRVPFPSIPLFRYDINPYIAIDGLVTTVQQLKAVRLPDKGRWDEVQALHKQFHSSDP